MLKPSDEAAPTTSAPRLPVGVPATLGDLPPGWRPGLAVKVLVGAVLALSVALRFWTRSPLWLDEALTVNISSAPVSQLPHLLSHDGAPPLYYVLLHYWMKVFGTGNVAVRALSGILGVANLPIAWLTGYRIGSKWWTLDAAGPDARRERDARGQVTGWSVTLLLATSPFAVYYDTEARMYGLVLLLGTLGVLAVTSLLRRPRWTAALALAVVTSAALYSHYWSLYIGVIAGVGALYCAVRGPHRIAARYILAGLGLGAITFLPWVPTLLFQVAHTGTPWASPADYTAIVFAFTQFAGGNSDAGRALALVFFFLLVLALFGAGVDRRHVSLDVRTRPGVRLVTAAVIGTLVVALVAGRLSGSTFADRYTSVIAFPALLIFAYGLTSLLDRRVRYTVLGLAVVFGLAASIPNASLLRTQAGQVGAALRADLRPGDVVGYCPDQLGPSVSRVLGPGHGQVTFPRDAPPQIVDWVNYTAAIRAASPYRFAQLLEHRAGSHDVFLVMAGGYQGFGNDCQDVADDLGVNRTRHNVVSIKASDTPFEIYEGMSLIRFAPR